MPRRTNEQILEEKRQQASQRRINNFVSQIKTGPRYLKKID